MVSAAVVGLGSNLGDRRARMAEAARRVGQAYPLVGASGLYECDAVGPPQPRYLNAAILLDGAPEPESLLEHLLAIERELGRVRRERWGPRPIDLDILFIEGVTIERPGLVVPHARLLERTFALRPLLDLLPDARDPKSGRPYVESLVALSEPALELVAAASDWLQVPNSAKSRVDIA